MENLQNHSSPEELLALLLSRGSLSRSSIALSTRLLRQECGLRELCALSEKELKEKYALSSTAAVLIRALPQLSELFFQSGVNQLNAETDRQSVIRYLSVSMRDLRFELFKVLCFDVHLRLCKISDMFRGSISSGTIYPREVINLMIENKAVYAIVAHNHPSGRCEPSESDIEVTKSLSRAMSSIQAELLDHIIIGQQEHFSFTQHGLLEKGDDGAIEIAECIDKGGRV